MNEALLQFNIRVMSYVSTLHNYSGIHENSHVLKIFISGSSEPSSLMFRAMKPYGLAEACQNLIIEKE